MQKLICLALLLLFSLTAQSKEKTTFYAYVSAEKTRDLVEPALLDSARDLTDALSHKGFKFTPLPEKADIVLIVKARFTGSQVIGSTTSFGRGILGGLMANSTPVVSKYCYVLVHAKSGNYEKDWYGYGPFWRKATEALANVFKKLVKTNAETILARRPR
jgi:hypothetical protein